MDFLNRNILPRFQERLDLSASELNDMEDIYCKAINELAGRIYILTNLVPAEKRSKYSEESSFLLLDVIDTINLRLNALEDRITTLEQERVSEIEEMRNSYKELEARLNALDDAAARKEDLNVVLYRTGSLE